MEPTTLPQFYSHLSPRSFGKPPDKSLKLKSLIQSLIQAANQAAGLNHRAFALLSKNASCLSHLIDDWTTNWLPCLSPRVEMARVTVSKSFNNDLGGFLGQGEPLLFVSPGVHFVEARASLRTETWDRVICRGWTSSLPRVWGIDWLLFCARVWARNLHIVGFFLVVDLVECRNILYVYVRILTDIIFMSKSFRVNRFSSRAD